jgi:hypothetical protein
MTTRGFSFDPGSFDTRLLLGSGRFTQRLLSGSLGSTSVEDARDRLLRLLPRQHVRLRYLIDRNKALAASILAVTGKSVFLDASKAADAIRHFGRESDLVFRVVHLVRDVRGFSCSRRKNKGEVELREIVGRWMSANANIERQLRRISPDRWIRIRYEDVCSMPLETLNRFFAFCGLAPLQSVNDSAPPEHHIVGNRMRLANFGAVRSDESWRRLLSGEDQQLIAGLAGSMHLRYGYKPMHSSDLAREAA